MLVQAIKASLLDARVYRDVGARPRTLLYAFGTVAAVAIAFGVGIRNVPVAGLEEIEGTLAFLGPRTVVMLVAISTVMVGWVIWSFVAYVVGTHLTGGNASYTVLVRSLGIAHAPGVFLLFADVPSAGSAVVIVVRLWMLAAGAVAVAEVQGYGRLRAVLPSLVGWFLGGVTLPVVMLPPV